MLEILKKISFLSLFVLLVFLCESCRYRTSAPDDSKTFFYDFENECDTSIWKNMRRVLDTDAFSGDYACECMSDMTYAFGFDLPIDDSIGNDNMLISIDMMLKSDSRINAIFAISLERDNKTILWNHFPLSDGFVTENQWYKTSFSLKIPNDVLKKSKLNCYVMNNENETFFIDDFNLNIKYFNIPSYIDEVREYGIPNDLKKITDTDGLNILYSEKEKQIVLADEENNVLTKPLSLFYALIVDNDTVEMQVSEVQSFDVGTQDIKLMMTCDSDITTELRMSYEKNNPNVNFDLETTFAEDVKLLRSSLIIPFISDDFKIYRRNHFVDTSDYQNVYYLDKEGFSIMYDMSAEVKQLNLYHPDKVSSIQFDARKSTAYVNMDYYYDHLLARFELLDTVDYFLDNSSSLMRKGELLTSSFVISLTNKSGLPRVMHVYDGYESAIIWTEHADWSDIKTHRATYFGSEDVVDIEDAVGGFAYYDIPVTKSVFYNNPDSINNFAKNPDFPGLHSTIMNDADFGAESYFYFLKQLSDNGFEICLHTPEQNTSNRDNMSEALSFMKENFASPTWIDHGYNNGISNNREDMVCDGLDSMSPYYVYDLWKENGVKFPWNASLEDMRPFENYLYDNNLLRPYPGFGDAFPLPRVMSLKDYPDVLLWTTFCATEPGENWAWDYYFSQDRLDKIVDFRDVLITHMYAPWVEIRRGFWEIKDGKYVAKDSFNETLERIAEMRDEHLLLPTTIESYMTYQQQLRQLEYRVNEDGSVMLKNNNKETIKGLSLISVKEMSLENGKSFNKRKTKSGDECIIWFDMEPGEELEISCQPSGISN